MRALKLALLPSAIAICASGFTPREDSLTENVKHYELVTAEQVHSTVRRATEFSGDGTLSAIDNHVIEYKTTVFGRLFHMELVRATPASDRTRGSDALVGDGLYQGRVLSSNVAEQTVGIVRGYMQDDHFRGSVSTEDEVFFFEPARRYAQHAHRRAGDRVVYRASDVSYKHTDGNTYAGAAMFKSLAAKKRNSLEHRPRYRRDELEESPSRETDGRVFNVTVTLTDSDNTCLVKAVSDHTYTQSHMTAGSAAKHMEWVIGEVDQIFSSGTFYAGANPWHIRVALAPFDPIDTYLSPTDYPENIKGLANETLDPEGVLLEFAKGTWNGYCLAHLFTHREHYGTLGLAYVASTDVDKPGGICAGRVSTSEGYLNLNTGMHSDIMFGQTIPDAVEVIATAHEIGHGFGALHDSLDWPCYGVPGGPYLMYASTSTKVQANNDQFSVCSVASIRSVLTAKVEKQCFMPYPGQYCGNGLLEGDEQCDAFGEGNCCTSDCKLKDGAVCAIAPCCDSATCQYQPAGTVCTAATGCLKRAVCTGEDTECPYQETLPDTTTCGSGEMQTDAWMCKTGVCANTLESQASIIPEETDDTVCSLLLDASQCNCPEDVGGCKLCCTFSGNIVNANSTNTGTNQNTTGPCITAESYCALNALIDPGCLVNAGKDAQLTRVPNFGGGYPCNDYTGFCDGHGDCKVASNPATASVVFPNPLVFIEYTWYYFVSGLIALLLLVLFYFIVNRFCPGNRRLRRKAIERTRRDVRTDLKRAKKKEKYQDTADELLESELSVENMDFARAISRDEYSDIDAYEMEARASHGSQYSTRSDRMFRAEGMSTSHDLFKTRTASHKAATPRMGQLSEEGVVSMLSLDHPVNSDDSDENEPSASGTTKV
ncbi:hypothetical protein SARC_00511 [Sphaeroforma arctica JP610]|uniref:Disintegrin domain-containing protein n=1 Tax=Sphaeroforma arctica JP610 TaxID=667725 RepID=A0A0L0GEC8_9EUKA|nr:hypothetical protein SARC_00511 [Sphaeroforma arctica JP610]KNC87370.1 hypothetical protein SARC_00511 [Sphaeroforma arctica JP610]|eukprot:XP_014161272.1 hypothetical protein SARC_00511 [Sphaeroforma arctica JP610]